MESLSKLKNKIDVDKILEKGSQAKNMMRNLVMNYSETEAKVMDATNNEPWGASSTLMQEIAKLTYQFEDFEEVMSTIYKRFVESGEIWRQIYKALNLLEYLIKNGSDKVVDYAKNHIYEIKSLMTYQHVDDKGKDQGLNVRNRAKEIILLLNSNDRIREEREKAKANRDKYIGVSSESRHSSSSSSLRSSSKYDDYEDRSDRYSKNEYDDDYQPHSRSAKSSQSQYESPAKSSSSTSFNQQNDDEFGEMNSAPVSKTTEAVRGLQFTQNPDAVNFNTSFPTIQKPQQSPVQQPKQQTFQQQSKQDDFGDFADFSSSSFSSNTTTITPMSTTTTSHTNTTSSLTGFADFNAFQTPQTTSHTPSQQQKQQNLDPFGDPFGSIPLDNNSGLLQPESKNKKTTASIATPNTNTGAAGGSDKFGFSGLVDLDNLKKYDSGKKEQKTAAPMGQIKSTTTTTSTSTTFSSPMGGSLNGGMNGGMGGSGMNQPMYGNMNSGNMYGNMNGNMNGGMGNMNGGMGGSGMGQPMYGNMNSGMNQPMYGNMNGGMNGSMNGNMNQGMGQPMYGNMRPMGQQQQQQQFFPQQSNQPW